MQPSSTLYFGLDGSRRLPLLMKDSVNRHDLEGIVVNLVDGCSVAETKPTWSGLHPFERRFFHAFLIFKNSVFLSMIVNELKFVYLVGFFGPHNPSSSWHSGMVTMMGLQQCFGSDGMGVRGHVARQQFCSADVRFGS
jgi:hypothetical protein